MSNPWPHDDRQSLIAFYGAPGHNLVRISAPWKMVDDDKPILPIHSFFIHQKCFDACTRIFAAIWKLYPTQELIEATGMHLFAGCYNDRTIRGSSRISVHAFGAALDFDSQHNQMNTSPRDPHRIPQQVIDCFKAEGAFWGGDFTHRHDPMHFQFAHE